MIQNIFFCGAAFVFLFAQVTNADEESAVAEVGFAATEWTLNQLTRMELNEQGQLRLKRDHWEIAAKRPSPKPQQGDARLRGGFGGGGMGMGMGAFGGGLRQGREVEQSPLEKLFNRLADESGGRRGGSSSSNGNNKRISFSSTSLKGDLNTTADSTEFEVEETVEDEQSLKLTDNDNTTRLVFRSPSTFVQILRNRDSVHVCSMIDGKTTSWTGHSFAEVVQQHEDYFRNTLQPALKKVTELPLDEAMEAKVTASDKPVDFPSMEFETGAFTEGTIAEAFSALARFQLVEGRLRINRFFGDRKMLEQEIEKVSGEFQKSLDQAVARLNERNASKAMIGELKNQLKWNRDEEDHAMNARGFGGGNLFAQADQPDSLLESFERLKSLAHQGGSSSNSRGGNSYSSSFSSGPISASISSSRGITNLQVKDSVAQIVVREAENLFELQIESSTGLLVINDQDGHSCSVLLVGGGECNFFQGVSFAALVNEHDTQYRDRILPILNRYNISGLDPFGKDSVDAILERLPGIAAGKLDIETAIGETDSWVFPLLNDAEYLKILASKLPGADQSAVIARASSLASR